MSSTLTADWIKKHRERLNHEFELNGYVSIPGFFAGEELDEIRSHKQHFVAEVVPTMPESQVYYEDVNDNSTLKQLQQMWQHDAYFAAMMAQGSKLTTLAEACLGESVRPVNMQYFNKPPGLGQPTPPHQDGFYFHLKPNRAVTMWFALEDVEPEQGPVHYVRGSHHYGMRAHGPSGVLGFSQRILDMGTEYDRQHTMSFPCRAGHLIAHHCLTIHWAEGNTSKDKSREAMGAIYYAASSEEDVTAKEAYQARLAEQLAAQGKI